MTDEMTDSEFVAALAEATTKALDVQRVAHATELGVVRAEVEVVRREFAEAVRAIPVCEKGEPGKDAVLDMDTLYDHIVQTVDGAVSKAVGEIDLSVLRGKDGEPGADGHDGKDGEKGEPGAAGTGGATGKRGEKGADGRDGRDGKDGIPSFDDLRAEMAKSKAELRDELPVLAKAAVAEVRAEDPWPVYREIWREGEYEKGAVVTWAGAAWIARETTNEKPGDGATKWKLFVKQGRDGRDAR